MAKFNKIVAVDYTALEPFARAEIGERADEVIFYEDIPSGDQEKIERIGDADCVLVSFNSRLDKEVLAACPNIRYIGICGSLYEEKSANVDIPFAREKGIQVLGVRDYGDEGPVEYVISSIISLTHGFGGLRFKENIMEFASGKFGIIGLGATGKMMAQRAQAFGVEVLYYDMQRYPEEEAKGVRYLPLPELLKQADYITTHLPRKTIVIDREGFAAMGNGKILINCSLGLTFDLAAFKEWIALDGNFAIFDKDGLGGCNAGLINRDNVIYLPRTSGITKQAKERLSRKVLENMDSFLQK